MNDLPHAVEKALAEFDEAAQRHGWEADQGSSRDAAAALLDYEQKRTVLRDAIADALAVAEEAGWDRCADSNDLPDGEA